MTHSHPLDFDITLTALRRETFNFVGLIGSETKRARFMHWAWQVDVTDEQANRLVCPTGIPRLKGKEPVVIAASLAAQLLIVRERAPSLREARAAELV
jgi:xanthine dehydrogenase accessory factor